MPLEQSKPLRDPIAQSSYQENPYDPVSAGNKGNMRPHSNGVRVQEEKGWAGVKQDQGQISETSYMMA